MKCVLPVRLGTNYSPHFVVWLCRCLDKPLAETVEPREGFLRMMPRTLPASEFH